MRSQLHNGLLFIEGLIVADFAPAVFRAMRSGGCLSC